MILCDHRQTFSLFEILGPKGGCHSLILVSVFMITVSIAYLIKLTGSRLDKTMSFTDVSLCQPGFTVIQFQTSSVAFW